MVAGTEVTQVCGLSLAISPRCRLLFAQYITSVSYLVGLKKSHKEDPGEKLKRFITQTHINIITQRPISLKLLRLFQRTINHSNFFCRFLSSVCNSYAIFGINKASVKGVTKALELSSSQFCTN